MRYAPLRLNATVTVEFDGRAGRETKVVPDARRAKALYGRLDREGKRPRVVGVVRH